MSLIYLIHPAFRRSGTEVLAQLRKMRTLSFPPEKQLPHRVTTSIGHFLAHQQRTGLHLLLHLSRCASLVVDSLKEGTLPHLLICVVQQLVCSPVTAIKYLNIR
jgi:hypothetical protein